MRGGTLRLRVGPSSLRAEAIHRGRVIWAGESPYSDLADLSDAIARLAAEPPRPCRRLTVALEHPPVQVRTLSEIPPVKPQALAALVANQAGRFFRKNGQPLATDAIWMGDGATRLVRAVAVEESLVESIVAGARGAGLAVETIGVADETVPLALLPSSERAARRRAEQRLVRRLAIRAATVWLIAGVCFAVRLAWQRRAVERELAALGAPLGAVLAARRELRDAEATVRAIASSERQRGRSLALLGALAGALPDSAMVTSLSWSSDGSGILSGSARRAADVVARLERTAEFPGARLEGPAVREAGGWERLTIVFGEQGAGSREQRGRTP